MTDQSSMQNASTSIREFSSIVCFDVGITSSAQIHSCIPVCTFERVSDCRSIRSQAQGKCIILIVSEHMVQDIVPSIHHLAQVFEIYVRRTGSGNNEEYSQFSKIRCVGLQLSELIHAIQICENRLQYLQERLSREAVDFEIIDQNSFSRSMSFISDSICAVLADERPIVEQAVGTSENILAQYARNSSFYHTINNVCRNLNLITHEDRRTIRAMYDALRQAQITEPICVYRGKIMRKQEVDVLQNSVSRPIVMNSFLSTTTNQDVALMFTGSQTNVNDMVSVLYVITGTYRQNMRPFADISQYTVFSEEREILFMVGSVFRIDAVILNHDGFFTVNMTVIDDHENEMHDLNN